MSWVWERFRNTFRSSAEDSSEDIDVETVRFSQLIENTVYLRTLWLRIAKDGISCYGH
jgi:hypothetical protein